MLSSLPERKRSADTLLIALLFPSAQIGSDGVTLYYSPTQRFALYEMKSFMEHRLFYPSGVLIYGHFLCSRSDVCLLAKVNIHSMYKVTHDPFYTVPSVLSGLLPAPRLSMLIE